MENEPILFYEREFYVFSNFSSFQVEYKGYLWQTSEQAYHAEKFTDPSIIQEIKAATSAHDSLQIARKHKDVRRSDWDQVKVGIMEDILRAKLQQHPYVQEKLAETGKREIIEDSHIDNFWGWGPHKDGKNHLGKIWMRLRSEFF